MKQITAIEIEYIKEQAKKYHVEGEIKISGSATDYILLIEPHKNTSAYQLLAFQDALSKKLAEEENLEVLTPAALTKKVANYKITAAEKDQILKEAQSLDSFLKNEQSLDSKSGEPLILPKESEDISSYKFR